MTNPFFVNDEHFEHDVLHEAIKSYKEAMRAPMQDLTIEYLVKALHSVKDSSVVKVARNPVLPDREWNVEAKLYNVRAVGVDEQNRLVVTARKDEEEFTVERFIAQLIHLKDEFRLPDVKGPIMFQVSEEKVVQLTDIYSHVTIEGHYGGMPIDMVLGYYEDDERA